MNKSRLIFSVGTGTALLAAGYTLASNGMADWGLFWTGGIILSLTLGTHLSTREANTGLQAPALLSPTSTAEH
jgi:hypothetical protein